MVLIESVVPDSPCGSLDIQGGDKLISINGREISDVLDYRFFLCEKKLRLLIEKASGTRREFKIRKGEYDDIGLCFETYLMDRQMHCANKCIFCFIDQLPKGMRKSLYFKDDDSRMSFLFGNYVTLTNMTDRDVDRIIEMHISPVNISVHTMNPELRVKMMKNKRAGEVLSYIKRFADAGIKLNTQLVLCPGINDGKELEYSLKELGKMYPAVQSIAAVPVGLTCHRKDLYPLEAYTPEQAKAVIDIIEDFNIHFMWYNGERIAYPADEFYLKAGIDIPDADYYGDFAQLENGVGLWASLKDEFLRALEDDLLIEELSGSVPFDSNISVSLATGEAAFNLLQELVDELRKKWHNLNIIIYKIKNDFFGESITVAGLLTGRDMIAQLSGRELCGRLLIPSVSLKRDGDVMLDDTGLDELSRALKVPVIPVPNDGETLLRSILDI
ncbi:MAG: DUF512 domain-containing protein [Clostridiales bacterium]|nr:DUF512 domain-containing protein [Clostridiales bacterium]